MMHGRLSDFFESVAVKRLAAVDADPGSSNQHEVTGSEPLLRILGDRPRKKNDRYHATYIWLGGEQEGFSENGRLSWYDSRERDPTRSAEWRLYYQSNPVTSAMRPGDTLILARHRSDHLFFIVAPQGTTIEAQLLWLFGFHEQVSLDFQPHELKPDVAAELDFTARFILDELGIEFEDPNADKLDEIIRHFSDKFPPTRQFSDLARLTLPEVDPLDDPDAALMAWLDHEEAMFRRLERRIVGQRLSEGFCSGEEADVDGFLYYSLQVQNRRKSRMGRALENQLEAVFLAHGLRFSTQAVTEHKNIPDFLFPGPAEYLSDEFPPERLTMLAAKASCKDRWRQILPEARRIWPKHLLTLEPAISPSQTQQMEEERVQLVVPGQIHDSYQPDQRLSLWRLRDFIDLVKQRDL
jgi:hypothetical protein